MMNKDRSAKASRYLIASRDLLASRYVLASRYALAAVLAILGAVLAAWTSLVAQSTPEIGYDANADFLSLPSGTYLGEVAGVATNSKGHVFVYTRTGHAVATLGDERTFYHN